MHIEQLREFCIRKNGATEEFPFDEVTLVFKVKGKMFALTSLAKWEKGDNSLNLKCNPDRAEKLRNEYESVQPGWHMNKKHWNTVTLNNDVSDDLAFELITHSYNLVIKGLSKKVQEELIKQL